METGTDGPADPRAAPSARGNIATTTAEAAGGGGGASNSVDVQRQGDRQAPSRGRMPLPANPYANTRKRPRAEVQQQQQPLPAQPHLRAHGQQSQPRANLGADAGPVVPSTRHVRVGVNSISNATGDRNAGKAASAAPAQAVSNTHATATEASSSSATTSGVGGLTTASTSAASAARLPHNPYAKRMPQPKPQPGAVSHAQHAQPQMGQSGQHAMQRAPETQPAHHRAQNAQVSIANATAGVSASSNRNANAKPSTNAVAATPRETTSACTNANATNTASASPQPNSKLSAGDEYGDGGIDWSAFDMSVAAGVGTTKTTSTAGTDNADNPGNNGRKDCVPVAVNKAATAVGKSTEMTAPASASNLKQEESRQSSKPQSNPYSLASGIGRPTAWSNPQQQQQQQLPQEQREEKGGSTVSVPPTSALYASASTAHVASAATTRPGSANGNAKIGAAPTASTSGPSSSSSAMVSGRAKELPPLPPMISYNPERVAPVDDGRRADLIRNAELSKKLLNGWKILPHQKSGVLRGLKMRRFILAFDMGLGKTLVGCVWGKAFKNTYPDLKIYAICPVSLSKEWIRTASSIVGLDCDDDGKEESPSPELDMHVCSWQKIPSPRKVPEEAKHFVVIADEAHQMQNITSGRTKDALALMQDKRCVGVLLLTGTPMKNGKPCNIFPLLRAVRHPFGDNQRLFETFFCNGMQKNFGGRMTWDASGSSNLNHLNAHIAHHMLFMTKEECLENLPPKTREFRKIPVSSRDELKHTNAMNDLAKLYQSTHSDTKGDDSRDRLLGAFNRVRLIASEAKIGGTVRIAQAVLEKEPAVVIFTNFVAVAKEVHRKLEESGWNGHVLTGETPPKKRQPMVDDFQAGLSAVFVCTFGAGGVGLTLTAAATIILLDRPWTPGDALQAEDRVRRIGQTKPVTSIWMRCFDVDEQIDILIEEKKQTSLAVVDRKSNYGSPSYTKAAPKISIFQLVNSIINRQSNADTLGGLKKVGPG